MCKRGLGKLLSGWNVCFFSRCLECRKSVPAGKHFCRACSDRRWYDLPKIRARAGAAVAAAVRRGELAPVRTLQCTDCGKPATQYDHRDYSKPLDVQPVCRSCNTKRGWAVQTRPRYAEGPRP